MSTRRSPSEQNGITLAGLLFALGCTDVNGPFDDDEHLLVGVMEVVGKAALSGTHDVDARSKHLTIKPSAETDAMPFVPGMILGAVPVR